MTIIIFYFADEWQDGWHTHPPGGSDMMSSKIHYGHEENDGLQCKICFKFLSSKGNLKTHMLVHQLPKFVCPVCDMRFKQKNNLKKHILRIHKVSMCFLCNAVFAPNSSSSHVCELGSAM